MSEKAVFGPGYADCYDHFYADKDYAAECDFLEEVFRRYATGPVHTILDLGCGTGCHALILAQRGYQVTGVDRSEEMLAIAQARAVSTLKRSNVPTFQHGDIRAFDLGRTFDALVAMFAVISYQTSNEDLLATFRAARRHLQPGGLFFFDAWFGPAVLMVRPADRYKVIEENGMRMIRFAHPELDLLRQTVSVHYQVLRLQDGRVVEETDEVHPMRFFFPQEILYYLGETGFVVRRLCPFLRLNEDISEREWNLAVVVEAV